MDWNELNTTFNKCYPNYEIIVCPPCISPTREIEYRMKAKAIVLGEINNDNTVIVNHNDKRVYYYRGGTTLEKRKEETRRFKASLDNGESFKANFEPANDFNWGMFKNED